LQQRYDEESVKKVIFGIIGANVLVFVMWQNKDLQGFMTKHFVTSYDAVLQGRPHTLLTSMYSQQGFMHLAFNMLSLYFLGMDVCARLGTRRFMFVYTVGGVCGALGHVLITNYYSSLRFGAQSRQAARVRRIGLLGASGAVMTTTTLFAVREGECVRVTTCLT
jgi:membrane associated rhomboid family serine protease